MGEFDTLKELLDHFECMPVLGNLSGKCKCTNVFKTFSNMCNGTFLRK